MRRPEALVLAGEVRGTVAAGPLNRAREPAGTCGTLTSVIPLDAVAVAYAQWIAPDLPLYGNDHERADFAP